MTDLLVRLGIRFSGRVPHARTEVCAPNHQRAEQTPLRSGQSNHALADWRVDHIAEHKIKKTADHAIPSFAFVENPDILASVAKLPHPPFCVGFAAESGDLDVHGEEKRKRKKVPLLIGNLGPQTFGLDDNEVVLFEAAGTTKLPRADKQTLARALIAEIAKRLPDASVIG